jgi:hypothetical protein
MGVWRLKFVSEKIEQGMCPMCKKEKDWSYRLRCEEIRSWTEKLTEKIFTISDPETGIRIVTN